MIDPVRRLAIAHELMDAGLLCKCPPGPTLEIDHPVMEGWYTKKRTIDHQPECEAKESILKILNFTEKSPETTVAKEKP